MMAFSIINIRRLWLLVAMGLTCAFLNAADWLTDAASPQRTAWQRDEKILSPATAKEIKLLWKIKLDSPPREMHNLFPALIADKVNTSAGIKQIAIVAGVSDNLFAIDVEAGQLIWQKHFENTWTPAHPQHGDDPLCPGGITATPVIAPAESPGKYTIFAVSWDGRLHRINVADGEELAVPSKFMPANGKAYALNLWKNVLYTHTAQGCGGNPNFAYAFDLPTGKVGSWGPAGGGMWGRSGPAISTSGVMYTGTGDGRWAPEDGIFGNGIIGLQQNPDTKALELADYFAPTNAEWLDTHDLDMQVTPAIFPFKDKELMVDAGKECRIYLMDTALIGGDDHRHPLYTTPLICNEDVNFASAGIWGSMATWEDSRKNRWVLSPFWGPPHSKFHAPIENGEVTHGAIVAFKVEEKNGRYRLNPVWISRDMNRAEPPIIANGVVFAYGSGENTEQAYPDIGLDDLSTKRIKASTRAVLYALDAETGKELWSSGDQIASWNHWTGLSVANGRVYIGTFDGILYCFGIKK